MITLLLRALLGLILVATVAREEVLPPAERAIAMDAVVISPSDAPDDPTCAPAIELDGRTFRQTFRVTAYCDRGLTAAGIPSGVGQCAAPANIPFGSKIYVPSLGQSFIVTDRTHKRFRHNTIDIFMPVRSDCLKFGRNYLECEVQLPEQKVRYAEPSLAATIADRSR
ncbi:MAG: 3D domain-containing protein [Planctomycetes bacterium]|nr:3D domain-containing protein [Planctomycetota bacterium]